MTAWVVVVLAVVDVVDGVVVVAFAVVEVVLAAVEAVAEPVVDPIDEDPVDRVAGVAAALVDWFDVPASEADAAVVSLEAVAVEVVAGWV
ncbi:MAG: hypothetical protein U0Q07_13805 [Acidimicrobiales bacterium]